jgi:hypothetical protein
VRRRPAPCRGGEPERAVREAPPRVVKKRSPASVPAPRQRPPSPRCLPRLLCRIPRSPARMRWSPARIPRSPARVLRSPRRRRKTLAGCCGPRGGAAKLWQAPPAPTQDSRAQSPFGPRNACRASRPCAGGEGPCQDAPPLRRTRRSLPGCRRGRAGCRGPWAGSVSRGQDPAAVGRIHHRRVRIRARTTRILTRRHTRRKNVARSRSESGRERGDPPQGRRILHTLASADTAPPDPAHARQRRHGAAGSCTRSPAPTRRRRILHTLASADTAAPLPSAAPSLPSAAPSLPSAAPSLPSAAPSLPRPGAAAPLGVGHHVARPESGGGGRCSPSSPVRSEVRSGSAHHDTRPRRRLRTPGQIEGPCRARPLPQATA